MLGDSSSTDSRLAVFIATDDGKILYILMPDATIKFITSIDTNIHNFELHLDENSRPGTPVRGVLRARSQFPQSITWVIDDKSADDDHIKCFDVEYSGSKDQTVTFITKDPHQEGCAYDYEDHYIQQLGKHGFEFTATAEDDTAHTNSDSQDFIIELVDQEEPPAPPINLILEPGPDRFKATWEPA